MAAETRTKEMVLKLQNICRGTYVRSAFIARQNAPIRSILMKAMLSL